ncbi:MAG TPA: response regulator [Puia sp.]|nr:response regulator [Puia sp.]
MRIAESYLLIADDDPEDRQALSEAFADQHPSVTVKHVAGGHELLRYLQECPIHQLPAVLVLDYQMPDLNGPQVLQYLTSHDRYRPIVIVMWSTSRRTKDIDECNRLGATHYLVKPDTIEELKNFIQKLNAIFETAARKARSLG